MSNKIESLSLPKEHMDLGLSGRQGNLPITLKNELSEAGRIVDQAIRTPRQNEELRERRDGVLCGLSDRMGRHYRLDASTETKISILEFRIKVAKGLRQDRSQEDI